MTLIYIIVFFTLLAIATPFILRKAFPHRVNWKEVALSVGVSVSISIISFIIAFGNIYSVKVVNGKVTDKKQVRTSCEHSYQICTPSTGFNGSPTVSCTTYYQHSHDYNWQVSTTVGDVNISRVDRRGTKEPPRFTEVKIGEPASLERVYVDYIKGSNSVFNTEKDIQRGHRFENLIPSYPRVEDFYNVNLVSSTYPISGVIIKELNKKLRESLITLNSKKDVNIIVVITDQDSSFGEYIKSYWNNGRENDAVLVIGTDGDEGNIIWSFVFGWNENQLFNVNLRNELLDVENISNVDGIIGLIHKNVDEYFNPQSMEEFEYLKFEREISNWHILLILILQLSGNIGISWYNYKNVGDSLSIIRNLRGRNYTTFR